MARKLAGCGGGRFENARSKVEANVSRAELSKVGWGEEVGCFAGDSMFGCDKVCLGSEVTSHVVECVSYCIAEGSFVGRLTSEEVVAVGV